MNIGPLCLLLHIIWFLLRKNEKGMPCNPATVPAAVNEIGYTVRDKTTV